MNEPSTHEYRQRVDRLLERIEAKRALLQQYREAHEPSLLNIDEASDLLDRYVDELDGLLRQHGLTVKLFSPVAA